MIRTLYLTISTLILVGSFAIPIYFSGGVGFPVGLTLYCIYALLGLVVSFISFYRGTTEGNVGDTITFPFGFLTFWFKRV